MPSHAPLSSRDGRIRSSSLRQGVEPFYYSNEDIELLHQVVALGQDILPTLPKRDKLPTTALFRAADIVFPRHGLDPDGEDKLSRIIFLVGGMRSTDNLLDRFRTVLGRMGIELEYVPDTSELEQNDDSHDDNNDMDGRHGGAHSMRHHRRRSSQMHASPPSPHPPSPPQSVHSIAPSSAGGLTSHSGVFPVAPHVTGRRRRNSDSVAEFVVAAGASRLDRGRQEHNHPRQRQHSQQHQQNQHQTRQHHRRRSDSLAPPLVNYKDYFGTEEEPRLPIQRPQQSHAPPQPQPQPRSQRTRPSHPPRPIDPWLSQVHAAAPEEAEYTQEIDEAEDLDNVQDEEAVEDDYDYDDDEDAPSVDQYTRSLDMLRVSAPRQNQQQLQKQHNALPELIGGNNAAHLSHNHNYQHHQQLPIRTRPFSQSLPPSAQPNVNHPDAYTNSHHSSMQPAGSWTEPQSPGSRISSVITDYEGFQFLGASDTTVQEELEAGPPPRVDPFIMAKVADTFFMRFAFLGGLAIDVWRTTCAAHQEQERYAAQMDRELSASEALLMWSNVANTHIDEMTRKTQQLGLTASQPATTEEQQPTNEVEAESEAEVEEVEDENDDEAEARYREKQEERERLMRRAARVYTITTLFNTVCHWQAMAKEEASRTKVARRHLLRRKVFGAWREQTASDNMKADGFALAWAVRRWTSALHRGPAENAQLALQFYRRDLVTTSFWTWLRAHQERMADAWAIDRLKKQAVEGWCKLTIAAAGAEDKAVKIARQSCLGAATTKWAEQAQSQALTFLSIEEQENETYLRAALQDWSKEAFCQAQLRNLQSTNEARTKAAALDFWRESAAEAQHRATQLDLDIAEEYVAHWHRETRLAIFRADYEYDLKMDAVQSWVLAEKLAFLVRYRDEQLLWKTCLAIKENFGTSDQYGGQSKEQQREAELAEVADRLDKANAFRGLVSAFRQQSERRTAWKEIAAYLDQESMANKSLGLWTAATAEHDEMNEIARRGAFYVGTANALSGWPAYAKSVRQERLRSTYYTFRREVKRKTASNCISKWRNAARLQGSEALNSGAYATADQLRYEHEAYTVFTTLNHWILETNDCLFQQTVAAEADAEVYLSRWRLQLSDCEELGAAAAEHDTVTQLAGRWDDWELQAVQARGREHTATALLEKNERRLGRRVLAAWQHELADQLYLGSIGPDDNGNDLRASYAGPSTSRWRGEENVGGGYSASVGPRAGGPGSTLWRLGASLSSPLTGRSDVQGYEEREDRREPTRVVQVGGRPASFLLHPITETPVTTTAQRPFFARGGRGAVVDGSYSVPAPATAPAQIETATETTQQLPSSGANQIRRLHRSTASAPYRQHEPGQQQPISQPRQQQPTPFRSSSSPEAAATTTPARASSYNHRLLQRRLQSAARLADSVQLGPMSEFDEAEIEAVAAEDDPLPLRDYADADVSSEGDDDLGLGRDSTTPLPDRRLHQLLSPTASHAANTPTRHLFRSGGSDMTAIAGSTSRQPTIPPARPPSQSIGSLPAQANRFRPSHSLLRKSAVVGAAAAASGTTFPPLSSVTFDPVTTTPMGPLPSPFERRLRAAYGDRQGDVQVDIDNKDGDSRQDYSTGQRSLPSLAAATPIRQLPLRGSFAASASTAPATGRTGARVTFADVGRERIEE